MKLYFICTLATLFFSRHLILLSVIYVHALNCSRPYNTMPSLWARNKQHQITIQTLRSLVQFVSDVEVLTFQCGDNQWLNVFYVYSKSCLFVQLTLELKTKDPFNMAVPTVLTFTHIDFGNWPVWPVYKWQVF